MQVGMPGSPTPSGRHSILHAGETRWRYTAQRGMMAQLMVTPREPENRSTRRFAAQRRRSPGRNLLPRVGPEKPVDRACSPVGRIRGRVRAVAALGVSAGTRPAAVRADAVNRGRRLPSRRADTVETSNERSAGLDLSARRAHRRRHGTPADLSQRVDAPADRGRTAPSQLPAGRRVARGTRLLGSPASGAGRLLGVA